MPDHVTQPRYGFERLLWIVLWTILMLAPSILLPFTASRSKASPAVAVCLLYLCWRLVGRAHPPLRHETVALSLLVAVYVTVQGAILVAGGAGFIVLLLQGQWTVYFLAGVFLAYDVAQTPGGPRFLSSAFIWISLAAAVCGVISIWTGPFYAYGHHASARWGLPIDRAIGTFESPATLSSVLEIAFLLEYFSPPRGSALRRTLTLSVLAVALLLTVAKGAIVTCLMVALFGGLVAAVKGGAISRKQAVLRIGGACASAAGILWLAGSYDIDVAQLIQDDAQGRYEVGSEVVNEYFADDLPPQLFGIGYRQSARLYSDEMIWHTAHNSYVSFLREIGAVGALLFMTLMACLLFRLYRAQLLAWAAALVGILLLSCTETFLYSSFLIAAIGASIGIVCALQQRPQPAAAEVL